MNYKNKKVAVAMSGGVDSSVASLLLMEQGYEVVGLTGIMSETTHKAVEEAAHVCNVLGIKHEVLDLRKDFSDLVIDYFEKSYINGLTPNPCVFCNRTIKWGKMAEFVFNQLTADFYATGHYVRIFDNKLYRAKDLKKDQSYMLFSLKQNDLARTIFPLGDMSKPEIRQIAAKHNLPVAQNKESQDVCFIQPPETTQSYLLKKFGKNPGKIVDYKTGEVLGEHCGTFNYTIGQRKGICVSGPEPYYVVTIDHTANQIAIGIKDDLYRNEFEVNYVNWQQAFSEEVMVKVRYNTPAKPGSIVKIGDDSVRVTLKEPKDAITPGQATVFYDITNEYVVGGGIIS